jgi:hypothetical protein
VKNPGDRLGHRANREPAFVGSLDDLVVDVRQVHDLMDLPTPQPQGAPEEIDEQEGAKIPEVRRVVDGRSATIDACSLAVRRGERLDLTRHRIVESELGHRGRPPNTFRAPHGACEREAKR